jgi:hypothetical protein
MTPTLGPNEVPPFWFCPHCVDQEWHIPPPNSPGISQLAPALSMVPATLVYPSPSLAEVAQRDITSATESETPPLQSPPVPRRVMPISERRGDIIGRHPDLTVIRRNAPSVEPQSKHHAPSHTKTKGSGRQLRRAYSPPRKRSKYSSFSSEVDKALAIIHKELEVSAQIGRVEKDSQDKILELEQQLKLKDGQIMLAQRELELAKSDNGQSSLLKAELADMKQQVEALKIQVKNKDTEFNDWRAKLRIMLGSEMVVT